MDHTSAVLNGRLHGALAVRDESRLGGSGSHALRPVFEVLRGPPALPQVHFIAIVHEKQRYNAHNEHALA